MNLLGTSTLWGVTEVKASCGPGCGCGPCQLSVGDPVTVDGSWRGRGVVTKINGRRITVQFRNEQAVERDIRYIHKI
jgi:hypothetical protein